MKRLLLWLHLLLPEVVCAQADTLCFFNEFMLYGNRTAVNQRGITNDFGWGAGAFMVFRRSKPLNIVTGLEYNRTHFFMDHSTISHTSDAVDITFKFNGWSVPAGLRFTVGEQISVYAESGFFLDMMISHWESGTLYYLSYDESTGSYSPSERTYREKSVYGYIFPGVYGAVGAVLPCRNGALLFRCEWKYAPVSPMEAGQTSIYNRYVRIGAGWRIKPGMKNAIRN